MRPTPLVLIGVIFLVVATSCSTTRSVHEPKLDELTAKQILERTAETYAECKSYRDSGLVKIVFVETDGERSVEWRFTTAFVRPGHFRFEYEEEKGDDQEYRHIVWRSGNDVRTWWYVEPRIKKAESLEMALAEATGVSAGSAHTIPALLLPHDIRGTRLTDMVETKRIDDARLGDAECFRIDGRFGGSARTLWVDKKTFLVRRLIDRNGETTTTYEPVIDAKIPERLLGFNPPKLR